MDVLSRIRCDGNDNGWIKHTLNPKANWVRWTGDPNKGFRVHVGCVSNYPADGLQNIIKYII